MLNKLSNRFVMICVSCLLTACASTAPTNYYVLESLSQPPLVTAHTTENNILIGIGPLSLPAVLDRDQIVTRTENNNIQIAEFDQWAAPLKGNIISILRQNMATLQPNFIVRAYPWNAYGDVNYRVIVDISRFDTQLGKSVNLEASWSIMEEKNHTIISNGQVKLDQQLTDASYNNAAQALSKLLSKFSQKLSLDLINIQQR